MKKLIKPLTERCKCGKKVENHHWICDECYSKKAKSRAHKKSEILLKDYWNIKNKKEPVILEQLKGGN